MTQHRLSRPLVMAITAIVAVTTMAWTSAANAAPPKPHVTLTVTSLPAQVRLIPGESIRLRLSTNVTTGYSWSTTVSGDKRAVKVSHGVYAAPDTSLIGAPGTTTWLVTATHKGTAVVTVLTTPPGSGQTDVVGRLRVIVQ